MNHNTRQLMAACLIFGLSAAAPFNATATEINAQSFERAAGSLIIEYKRFHAMLGDANSTVVRVFGDGTVTVTLPESHPRAGEYQYAIDDRLLTSLVQSIVEADQSDPTVQQRSEAYAVSDSTFTNISLRIESYVNTNGAEVTLAAPLELKEENLFDKARRNNSDRDVDLFSVEQALMDMTNNQQMELMSK